MFAASKSGSADAKDAQFKNVTMLLHGNGTNGAQNNTFLDSSTNNFTITRNGNTTQGTFTPYGSNWSNYFDGSGDYLTAPDSAALTFATGDWTAECWCYPTVAGAVSCLFARRATGATYGALSVHQETGGLYMLCGNGSSFLININGTSMTVNAWNHIAAVRNGSTFTLYLNGSQIATATSSGSLDSASSVFSIGALGNGADIFDGGYISNFRFVKGTAVYSGSTYTVPTTPLTAITNTSLLTCQSNRFIDNSTNNFTITKNGDTSVQRFSPFSPTTAYSTSVIGGSGYFDGSGDYLTFPLTQTPLLLSNSDFTFEAWVYRVSGTSSAVVFAGQSDLNTVAGSSYVFYVSASGTSDLYCGGSGFGITNPNAPVGAWSHVAWARTGGTYSSYLNGVRVGTRADLGTSAVNTGSTSYASSMGASQTGSALNGYIAGARLIKGSGGYDATQSTITVPTTVPTTTANTTLLVNYTNAGILDNAMMNDLETVGNAKISTSVKKFGTGSMYFDGTGDYLMSIANQSLELGSGDYTLECWVNISAAAANGGIISKGPIGNLTNTTWSLEFNGSANTVSYYVYNANNAVYIINGTSNIKTSTWIHLAICRSGNNTRLFVNGTQEGSTYTSGYTISAGDNLYIGGGFYAPTTRTITGYIDDLRISKVARYASNFTAPSAPFADKG